MISMVKCRYVVVSGSKLWESGGKFYKLIERFYVIAGKNCGIMCLQGGNFGKGCCKRVSCAKWR